MGVKTGIIFHLLSAAHHFHDGNIDILVNIKAGMTCALYFHLQKLSANLLDYIIETQRFHVNFI